MKEFFKKSTKNLLVSIFLSTFALANQKTVRWMNGLVSGLQNQLRRFESATHL